MKGLDDYLCAHSTEDFKKLPYFQITGDAAGPFTDWAFDNIAAWLMDDPPKQEWLFSNLIPKGIVGVITAQGGTGKTYMMLYIILSAITGTPFFKCFHPFKSLKVLALLGEDSSNEIWRRFKAILKNPDVKLKLDDLKNLRLLCGKSKPLMALEGGNPSLTQTQEWLKSQVEDFMPDLIIIDPKSQWFGLEENNNDHNTQWVNCLKDLAAINGATVLFTHHVAKSSSNRLDQNAARGASALTDACRWVANMRRMDEETAKKYEIEDHWKYVELLVTKNSYAPMLPGTLVFKFEENGSLSQVELETRRVAKIAEAIRDTLGKKLGNFSQRDITKESVGKKFREQTASMLAGKLTAKDLAKGIEFGLRSGLFEERDIQIGPRRQPKKVISLATDVF